MRTIRAAAAIAIGLAALSLVALVFFAGEAERYTSGLPPTQFYRTLEADLLDDYGDVFGIAHNSGDSIAATREALEHGADVIEIDVVSFDGELWAGHDSPLPLVGRRFFRGPKLEAVWAEAATADVVKLDLKESSAGFLNLLVRFLETHREQDSLVATRDAPSLRVLRDRVPHAFRILSVPSARRLDALLRDDELLRLIDGITIRESVLDDGAARRLEGLGLLVVAWTVNDSQRLNDLVRLGVDALTTDNLAIMRLLGANARQEAPLVRREVARG